jgi:hypothetical protein
MSKISRVVVLVAALMSMFGVLASSAGAVTWKSSSTTTFTADGGPFSISGNGKTLSCTGSTATSAVTALDFTGAVWTNAIHGHITSTACTLAGVPWTWSCTYSYNAATITGHAVNGTLNLNAPNGCTANFSGIVCRIEGTAGATYHNPETGADARLTVPATSLTATNAVSRCPFIAGASGSVSLTPQTFTVTGANPPTISTS